MEAKEILKINPLLADRVRLAIMATLASKEEPTVFTLLLQTLELSKGNLATHLSKLEEASFIEVTKRFVNRKPETSYRCTAVGREALLDYLGRVEQLLKGAQR